MTGSHTGRSLRQDRPPSASGKALPINSPQRFLLDKGHRSLHIYRDNAAVAACLPPLLLQSRWHKRKKHLEDKVGCWTAKKTFSRQKNLLKNSSCSCLLLDAIKAEANKGSLIHLYWKVCSFSSEKLEAVQFLAGCQPSNLHVMETLKAGSLCMRTLWVLEAAIPHSFSQLPATRRLYSTGCMLPSVSHGRLCSGCGVLYVSPANISSSCFGMD